MRRPRARFENGDEVELALRRQTKRKPTDHLRHVYHDSVPCDLRPLKYRAIRSANAQGVFGL